MMTMSPARKASRRAAPAHTPLPEDAVDGEPVYQGEAGQRPLLDVEALALRGLP